MNRKFALIAMAGAVALAAAPVGAAFAAPLAEQHQGQVAFVNGGIGDAEISAIKGMMKDYQVAIVVAEHRNGEDVYLADVPITVRDAKGNDVFNIKGGGPYVLLKLPRGEYTAEASHNGKVETRRFTSGAGTTRVTFDWA